MSENKIPDFFEFVRSEFGVDYIPNMLDSFDYSDVAIKFAKMHVEKALESAEHATNTRGIQHCYPLENIK